MPDPVSIGQMLILREEFEQVSRDPHNASGVRLRANLLLRILDEMLMWRESAGAEEDDAPCS
jgi:hypothetical protein